MESRGLRTVPTLKDVLEPASSHAQGTSKLFPILTVTTMSHYSREQMVLLAEADGDKHTHTHVWIFFLSGNMRTACIYVSVSH